MVELDRRKQADACRLAFGEVMTGAGVLPQELGPLWRDGALPKPPARRRAARAALKAYLNQPIV